MTDYAWLIERIYNEFFIEYACVKNEKIVWESHWMNAIRFHRKEDADAVIDGFRLDGAFPAEHGWG